MVREVFHHITLDGKEFVTIEPQPAYVPLFATMVADQKFGYRAPDSPVQVRPAQEACSRWTVDVCQSMVYDQASQALEALKNRSPAYMQRRVGFRSGS